MFDTGLSDGLVVGTLELAKIAGCITQNIF